MTDAKPVDTVPMSEDVLRAWLREEMLLGLMAATSVPMSFVDGRPWVPTHEEAHPALLWGNGIEGGCGHDLCDGGWGRNLTGLLADTKGIKDMTEDAKRVNTPGLGRAKRVTPPIEPQKRPRPGVARRLLGKRKGKR